MSTLLEQVYRTLATGQTLSGEALAQGLGVTRSAVWKAIETLRGLGLSIEAQTQRGYRLASPVQPLDAATLRTALQALSDRLHSLEVRWSAPSTNAELLAAPAPPVGQFDVLLVEHQSAGRGRRGRAWRSALGDSVCLSVATSFDPTPRDLPALTLVIGLSVRAALQRCGASGVGLKWPNDLVLMQLDATGQRTRAKLGGILGAGLGVFGFFEQFALSAILIALPMAASMLMLLRHGVETRGVRLEDIQASLER